MNFTTLWQNHSQQAGPEGRVQLDPQRVDKLDPKLDSG